jgi:tetratricopeptide (TPR) repeat protein
MAASGVIDPWRALLVQGSELHAQGRYAEAEIPLAKALALARAFGFADARLALTMNNLAAAHQEQGHYSEAERYYLSAIAVWERAGDSESFGLPESWHNLAGLYTSMHRYSLAEGAFRRALAIKRERLAPDLSLVATLHSLGNVCRLRGKSLEARQIYEEALAIIGRNNTPMRTEVANAYNSLAVLNFEEGRKDEAIAQFERAARIWESALGAGHPALAPIWNNLGTAYAAMGRRPAAESNYARAAQLIERTLGNAHPQLAMVLLNQAELLRAMGRKKDAKRCEERSRAIRETHERENHLDKTIDASAFARYGRDAKR